MYQFRLFECQNQIQSGVDDGNDFALFGTNAAINQRNETKPFK